MPIVSALFKQHINTYGRELASRISFDDVVLSETQIIKLDKEFDADFYRSVMQQIEGEVKGRYDLTDKVLHIELGVKYGSSAIEWADYGFFIVKDHTRIVGETEAFDRTTFKAYDVMLNAHVIYNPELFSYPISLYDLFTQIATLMGTTVINDGIVNGDMLIEEDKWINLEDVTYRNILDEVSAASGSSIIVHDNKLLAKVVDTDLTSAEIEALPKIYENNMRSLELSEPFGSVNILNLTREPQHDNYVLPVDWETIPVDERVEIVIPNNQIMDKRREEYAPELLDTIQGLHYFPFTAESSGIAYLEPLDTVNIIDMNGISHVSVLTSNRLQIGSGIKETLISSVPFYTKEKYALITDNRREFLRVYFLVDQQNGMIQLLIQQIGDRSEKTSSITQEIDQILLLVQSLNQVNLIPNNVGLSGLEHWSFIARPVFAQENPPYAYARTVLPLYMINPNNPIMEVVDVNSRAGLGFRVWKDGVILSGKALVVGNQNYYLRVRTVGTGKLFFKVRQYEDDELLSTTDLVFANFSMALAVNDGEFTTLANCNNIQLEIVSTVSPYGETESTIFTDLMLTMNAHSDYFLTTDDVLAYTQAQILLLNNLIELKASQSSVNELSGRVDSAESSITVLSNEITLKVDVTDFTGENFVSLINLQPSTIKIETKNLDVSGLVSFTNLETAGQTVIDGGNITTNSITANKLNVTSLSAISANLGSITGGSLNINNAFIVDSNGALTATSANISGTITASSGTIGGWSVGSNLTRSGITLGNNFIGLTGTSTSDATLNFINASNPSDIVRIYRSGTSNLIGIDGNLLISGTLNSRSVIPVSNSTYTLGSSGYAFSYVYSTIAYHGGIYPFGGTSNIGLSGSGVGNRFSTIYLINQPNVSSDERVKKHIKELDFGKELVYKLNPISYRMKGEPNDAPVHAGLSGQNVKAILEELNIKNSALLDEDEEGNLSLAYGELTSPIIQAIQDLNERIKVLEHAS